MDYSKCRKGLGVNEKRPSWIVFISISWIFFSEELTNYTITSDSQINTLEGDLEAKGNVVIKSNSGNFEAYSDKLSFDKDEKSLKLLGNVYVINLESEGISIEETSGDELTIFTDTGLFEFKSQNKNRVKTKIKF